MSWNLVTVAFGSSKYKKGQRFLEKQAERYGVNHIGFDDTNLTNPDLRDWFAWKPYFILEAMKQLEEGDKILCLDALDIVHPDIFNYVDEMMGDDPCLLPLGNSRNGDYTKRDCFHFMDCDDEDYWDSNQLEAGFTFWRVCDEAKGILKEWLMWCIDERVNGDLTDESGLPQVDGFKECRHDQSILTNLAIRDGLSVVGQEIRTLIECNADYWYERQEKGGAPVYRPIDQYMIAIKKSVDYLQKVTDSIILTVHNQEDIIPTILKGIEDNTEGEYELIVVVDGCTDNSMGVITEYLKNSTIKNHEIIVTDDIYENRANNVGLRVAKGKYATIVQDDQWIKEKGWNTRMHKPFEAFGDVFAVTARTAHNIIFNPRSQHIGMKENLDNCWCDILDNVDISEQRNQPRDKFVIRGSVNRGPLMVDLEDMRKLNYFDELFAPQQLDDHDLMFRMRKELGKVCGCYWIDFEHDASWGASRKETTGFSEANPVNAMSHHKNSKIFHERYSHLYDEYRIIDERYLPE